MPMMQEIAKATMIMLVIFDPGKSMPDHFAVRTRDIVKSDDKNRLKNTRSIILMVNDGVIFKRLLLFIPYSSVSESSYRSDIDFGELCNLVPYTIDMHLDGIGKAVCFRAPELVHKLILGKNLLGVGQ